ncbi:MAG: hypothetical protein KF821_09440 [Anaerolineales bacterium]|nr:hypothetical protein [Anaerolineales bacterium]MBX3006031.1 hypothetical protein [Anaerolineales bacterium]MCW5838985.1 hypothetical protein [Anaerolineales bacterium]MCW5887891.1 hypothetical protein [Anaerolineales bacterium]
MTPAELLAAADSALAAAGYRRGAALPGLDAGYVAAAARLGLAVLPATPPPTDYRQAFDAGLQRLLAARHSDADVRLALAVDLSNAAAAPANSYRPALNKYRSSVVFEDVGIGLLLLGHAQPPGVWLPPAEVSPFLRQLNRWLLGAR